MIIINVISLYIARFKIFVPILMMYSNMFFMLIPNKIKHLKYNEEENITFSLSGT